MRPIDEFFLVVDRYCEASGIAESTLSHRLFNDGKRIRVIRQNEDSDIGIKKVEAAMKQLSETWPDGTQWPRQVRRPVATTQ